MAKITEVLPDADRSVYRARFEFALTRRPVGYSIILLGLVTRKKLGSDDLTHPKFFTAEGDVPFTPSEIADLKRNHDAVQEFFEQMLQHVEGDALKAMLEDLEVACRAALKNKGYDANVVMHH